MEEEKIVKRRGFFDHLRVIYQTKDYAQMEADIAEPTFRSDFSVFMCLRYLSFCPEFLDIIKDHQVVIQKMSPEVAYRYFFAVIPQRKNLWIKYVSKKKAASE